MPCLYSKDALELTSAQMGMWLANEVSFNPGNNNISEYMIIDGAMDSELFKTAIRKMISEAESMHSRFLYFNNAVKQRLDVVDDYDAGFYDFSSMPDPWADAEVCIKTIFNKNYPLPDGKAFDFFLIKISEEKYVYCHCCHHILLDGFGAFLILKRTIEIYNCLVSGKPVPSTPFGSFKTLIKDDYDYRVSNRFSRDRQYWMSRFSDMPEPVSLAGRSAPKNQHQ